MALTVQSSIPNQIVREMLLESSVRIGFLRFHEPESTMYVQTVPRHFITGGFITGAFITADSSLALSSFRHIHHRHIHHFFSLKYFLNTVFYAGSVGLAFKNI